MDFQQFIYKVKAHIIIPYDEVEQIRTIALHHYDGKCKDAAKAKIGGFINGWHNSYKFECDDPSQSRPLEFTVDMDQVDTVCKILEMEYLYFDYKFTRPLKDEWDTLFHKMNEEQRRINKLP